MNKRKERVKFFLFDSCLKTNKEFNFYTLILFFQYTQTHIYYSFSSQLLLFLCTTYILSRRFDDRQNNVFASGVHVHIRLKHVISIEIYSSKEKVMKDKHHHASTYTYRAFLFHHTRNFKGFCFFFFPFQIFIRIRRSDLIRKDFKMGSSYFFFLHPHLINLRGII